MFLPHLVRLVEMHYVLQHVTKLFMLTNCHLYIVSTMVPGVLLILWMIDGIILGGYELWICFFKKLKDRNSMNWSITKIMRISWHSSSIIHTRQDSYVPIFILNWLNVMVIFLLLRLCFLKKKPTCKKGRHSMRLFSLS